MALLPLNIDLVKVKTKDPYSTVMMPHNLLLYHFEVLPS